MILSKQFFNLFHAYARKNNMWILDFRSASFATAAMVRGYHTRTRVARFSREVAQHQGKAHLQSQGARGASDRGGGGGLVAGITDLAARDQLQRASSFFGRQL